MNQPEKCEQNHKAFCAVCQCYEREKKAKSKPISNMSKRICQQNEANLPHGVNNFNQILETILINDEKIHWMKIFV